MPQGLIGGEWYRRGLRICRNGHTGRERPEVRLARGGGQSHRGACRCGSRIGQRSAGRGCCPGFRAGGLPDRERMCGDIVAVGGLGGLSACTGPWRGDGRVECKSDTDEGQPWLPDHRLLLLPGRAGIGGAEGLAALVFGSAAPTARRYSMRRWLSSATFWGA